MCGDGKLAEFRSVERLDPTTVTIYPDRVVVAHGEADAAPRVVALTEIARVKVRAVFGIASLRIQTRDGRVVVADLLNRADAESAKAQIEALMSAPTTSLPADGEARDVGGDVELASEGR